METKRALLVDDEPQILDLLGIILEVEAGFQGNQIIQCQDSRKAVDLARRYKPEIILLDILMPEKDGREVLRELKADPETADIPIILVSVLCRPETVQELHNLGAAAYITKPFSAKKLAETVLETIGVAGKL